MPKATAETQVVAALTSFVGAVGPNDTLSNVLKGWIFAADDPIVLKYPAYFGPVAVRRSAPDLRIEQATAAPGEKRGA
jgi:hypothetical protein